MAIPLWNPAKLKGEIYQSGFSGTDIKAYLHVPGLRQSTVLIGDIVLLSCSIQRDVVPVRTLGLASPRGFVRGPRTAAGTIIWNHIEHASIRAWKQAILEMLHQEVQSRRLNAKSLRVPTFLYTDEMPPFHITVTMRNDLFSETALQLEDVILFNEGIVMSVDELITRRRAEYFARNLWTDATGTPIRPPS